MRGAFEVDELREYVTPGGDSESFVVLLKVVCREVRLPLTFELIKSDPENEGVF